MLRIIDSPVGYDEANNTIGSTVYHHPAWRSALACYGLASYCLVAEQDGVAVGVLPLARQSSVLFGRRLASLPWVDEAGAAGEPAAVAALMEHAASLAADCGSSYSVVLKQPIGSGLGEIPHGWTVGHGDKVLMRLRLGRSSEDLWDSFKPKVRNQVRKAERSGLVTTQGGVELVDEFFAIYSQNMRDLGSPSHSLKFFKTLLSGLGNRAHVYCIRHKERVVGAGVVLNNGRSMDIPWASSLRECNSSCVNHGMYWSIFSDACDAGHEWFHFGRSSVGSGQHKFKKQWGAEEAPLAWLTHTQHQQEASADNPTAVREKYGLAERVWTKLPLWVSRRMGPHIIRHAP